MDGFFFFNSIVTGYNITMGFINLGKQNALYEICLSTCDDWADGHDLFPEKQFSMAGDRYAFCSLSSLYLVVVALLHINHLGPIIKIQILIILISVRL